MADIRINSLPTTASASSSDDYIALDGTTNGTRKLNAYSPTFGGNLTVSGTGNNSFTGPITNPGASWSYFTSGTNYYSINAANAVYNPTSSTWSVTTSATPSWRYDLIGHSSSTSNGVEWLYRAGSAAANSWTAFMRLAGSGNLLIGTTTDSGNGKLQLATHTTSAGGIGFGTDISLFRKDATSLKLNSSFDISNGSTGSSIVNAIQLNGGGSSGTNNILDAVQWGGGGLAWLRMYGIRDAGGGYGGTMYFQTMNGSGTLTTALTLDSSQHFKLTPAVASSITTTQSAPQIRMGSRASGRSNVVLDSTAGRVWSLENTGTSLTVGYSGLDAITIAETTGDATFAGTVKIANTAQIKGVYTTTTTFDFGTIANNDASSVCTLTMTGVSSSDSIIVSPTDGDNFPQFCTVSAVPSGNSVSVRLYNGSGSSRTVGSRTIRVTAIKF